jgi:hypothetical protein
VAEGTGGEDVRLIDADALPNELFKKHVHDGEELEPMLYFEDAVKVVENAPTIAAIPMDWMDARIHGYASRLQSTELKALLIVSRLWEMEQEAR